MTDLPRLFSAYREALKGAIEQTVEEGHYVGGPSVQAFEAEWSAYTGAQHSIGVGNGTDALVVSLMALGIGHGDRVATVSLTAVATAAAIRLAGAEPVWVDVDREYMTMSVEGLEAVLDRYAATPNPVKAIIPVHLYGHPADMPAIMELAARFECAVVEDCAQAHGARIGTAHCGTFGHLAAFSFYPTKNLGCMGDGGAVCTRDASLARKARMIAQYGWQQRNHSEVPGLNSRLDTVQAAILRVRLPHLAAENARRRAIALQYTRAFADLPVVLPRQRYGYHCVYHQYAIRVAERAGLMRQLALLGIETQIHYPTPIHLQPAFQASGSSGLEQTEAACRSVLSIPVHPALTDEAVARIIDSIVSYFK